MINKCVSVSKGGPLPISKLLVGRRVAFIILCLNTQNGIDVAEVSVELKIKMFLLLGVIYLQIHASDQSVQMFPWLTSASITHILKLIFS